MKLPEKFPTTEIEFEREFGTEEACERYLEKVRWPDGFRCECGGSGKRLRSRSLWQCRVCHRQTSLTSGTIFHKTHKPLTLWFRAMFLMVSQKSGISALNFKRMMGLSSYETAWVWLHKLRACMVRPGRPRLWGFVEVDESSVVTTAETRGKPGRPTPLVIGAVEREHKRLGRVRLGVISQATAAELGAFVKANVEEDSSLLTDGWSAYLHLGGEYAHRPRTIGYPKNQAVQFLPAIHRIFSILKRWLLGTHQGAVSSKHLHAYLDEFTFRFNRRFASHPFKIFHRLAQQAIATPALTYDALIAEPLPLVAS